MASRKKTATIERTAVLVLGAPRSGTSAVSHLLSGLGVYFGDPDHFVDPEVHRHNPVFFELAGLNRINDRVLAEQGYQYGEFDHLPAPDARPSYSAALRDEAEALVREELAGHALVGLKDPRFSFTLPFWRTVLPRMGYRVRCVVTQRSYQATVRSNAKVNTLHSFPYNTRLVWLSVGLAAARLRGLDASAVIPVQYDALVEAPETVAGELARWLGVRAPKITEAAAVVRRELRHEVIAAQDAAPVPPDLAAQAEDYVSLRERLQALGFLDLLDQRREQIEALEAKLRAQEEQIAAAHLEHERLRDAVEAERRTHQEQVAAAHLEQGRLRDALDTLVQLPGAIGQQTDAAIRPLVERVDWNSRAFEEQGKYLRELAELSTRAQEELHQAIARLKDDAALASEQARGREAELESRIAELQRELDHQAMAANQIHEQHERQQQQLRDAVAALQARLEDASDEAKRLREAAWLAAEQQRASQIALGEIEEAMRVVQSRYESECNERKTAELRAARMVDEIEALVAREAERRVVAVPEAPVEAPPARRAWRLWH